MARALLAVLLLVLACATAAAGPRCSAREDVCEAPVLRVPPGASIQRAAQLAPDGATLSLDAGVYTEAVQIVGKTLRIVGAGESGRTLLRAPTADDTALTFAAGAGGEVRGLSIEGGARGVSGAEAGEVSLRHVRIAGALEGIAGTFAALRAQHVDVDGLEGGDVGIHLVSPGLFDVSHVSVAGFDGGGLHVHGDGAGLGFVVESKFEDHGRAGVLLDQVQLSIVSHSRVTGARAVDAAWGDGIVVVGGRAEIEHSAVFASQRAGVSVFGGVAQLSFTNLVGNAVDLDREEWGGAMGAFEEGAQVRCYDAALDERACVAMSSQPAAPEDLG